METEQKHECPAWCGKVMAGGIEPARCPTCQACKPWCGTNLGPSDSCYDLNGGDSACYCDHHGEGRATAYCSRACLAKHGVIR